MRETRILVAVATLLIALWGCEKAPEPVGRAGVEPAQVDLAFPGYVKVRLHWDMTAPLEEIDGKPIVFVHLLDAEGDVERTFDHPLPFRWQPGTTEEYEVALYQSVLAPPLDEGDYRLSLGLYDQSGRRWALTETGEEVARLEYLAANVGTTATAADVPMFYFSASWLPLEAGTDVQILGRRWLTEEGTIRVAEVPGEGTVWLSLLIPRADPEVEEMTLRAGESEPGFVLTSDCGGEESRIFGAGTYEVQVPIRIDEEGALPEECEIALQPNFEIVGVDTLSRRSVGLEVLSWSAE